MRISNLARLLNGILLNNPSISQINGFCFDAKNIKQQNAFICLIPNQTEIDLAVKNGAYAVIASENLKITDPEIAYIKASDIQSSLFRLMRFFVGEKRLKFFYANAVQMSILRRINIKNANLATTKIDELFKSIDNATDNEIFFSDDTPLLQQLSPTYEAIGIQKNSTQINPSSIFFINTICDGVYYQNLNIPQIFLDDFCGLIKFLNQKSISFKFSDIKNIGHFEPIFIDKDFSIAPFGSTFRAVIAEENAELFEMEAKYLNDKFSQDDFIIAVSKEINLNTTNCYYFQNLCEIKKFKNFRYMLVLCKKNELLDLLSETKEESLLFG